MNWTKWSSIAEIMSSIAVIATLLLLLAGIKENTEMTRVAAYQSIIEQTNVWRYNITSNPQTAEIFNNFLKGEIPTEGSTEMMILNMSVDAVINSQEVSFYVRQAGNIGDLEWVRLLRNICNTRDMVSSSGIGDRINFRLTREFVTYVDENC